MIPGSYGGGNSSAAGSDDDGGGFSFQIDFQINCHVSIDLRWRKMANAVMEIC